MTNTLIFLAASLGVTLGALLQDVLASCRDAHADLHVRLSEGVNALALDVQAAASAGGAPAPMPEALAGQVRRLGGVLRTACPATGRCRSRCALPPRRCRSPDAHVRPRIGSCSLSV